MSPAKQVCCSIGYGQNTSGLIQQIQLSWKDEWAFFCMKSPSLALGEQFPELAAAWELQLPQILICSRHASHTILQSDGGALYLLQPPQQGQSMFYFYLPCLLCSLLNHWRVTQNLPLYEQSATWQKAQRIWAEECCHFLPFFFLEKEQILLLWSVVLNPGSSGLLIAASYCVRMHEEGEACSRCVCTSRDTTVGQRQASSGHLFLNSQALPSSVGVLGAGSASSCSHFGTSASNCAKLQAQSVQNCFYWFVKSEKKKERNVAILTASLVRESWWQPYVYLHLN